MKICALDLATNCGYAFNNGEFHCGTLALATDKEVTAFRKMRLDRRQDPRVLKFFERLCHWQEIHKFDLFIFEDVEFQTYTYQCQLWSALRAALWTAIGSKAILECVPVATLKRFATGHGGATKAMMCSALIRKDNRFTRSYHPERVTYLPDVRNPSKTLSEAVRDDNAVDAVWLWKWAERNLSRIKR